jgi:RNA polymerase sigma-70 factor (ECF subfamily)
LAWPDFFVTDAAFAKHLADRVEIDLLFADGLAKPPIADLYLACACSAGDSVALAALEEQYLGGLRGVLLGLGLPEDVAQEAQQCVRIKLLLGTEQAPSKLSSYRGAGELKAWIRTVAIREALHILRRSKKEIVVATEAADDWPVPRQEPELAYLKQHHRHAFKEAFLEAFARLSPRERNLLRQHFVYGMTIDQIGTMYSIHRVTALRWSGRARAKLLETTRKMLQKRFRMNAAEAQSLLRVMNTGLRVTLERLLEDENETASG